VINSTPRTKFGRLLISVLRPMLLLTTLSMVANGQAIDKGASASPQAKDAFLKPQTGDISAKPQAANARSQSANSAVSSQKIIRTGDSDAAAIEATSGSFRLDTGTQGKRSYHLKTPYGALNVPN
jgi:hypothetical protein